MITQSATESFTLAGDSYFPLPDPQADALWQTFIRLTTAGSRDCLLDFTLQDQQKAVALYSTWNDEIIGGSDSLEAVEARIHVLVPQFGSGAK